MDGTKKKRKKIELIILACMLGVMWVNVAILGGDFKVKIVHAGGGYECGTGCICSNEDSTPMTCRGPAVCNNVNAGAGSVDKVFIDNLGTCDPKWGTYSFDQYCDWPCGTVEARLQDHVVSGRVVRGRRVCRWGTRPMPVNVLTTIHLFRLGHTTAILVYKKRALLALLGVG